MNVLAPSESKSYLASADFTARRQLDVVGGAVNPADLEIGLCAVEVTQDIGPLNFVDELA